MLADLIMVPGLYDNQIGRWHVIFTVVGVSKRRCWYAGRLMRVAYQQQGVEEAVY